jgi:hypothetical protein
MTPRWTSSSLKHGVPRADQVWAMVHATYSARLTDESIDDGEVWLYIGHPHAQTDREIEILVTVYPDGREALVFHAMELGPKFRRYREDDPNA